MIKLLPIVVLALLFSFCAPLSVSTFAVTEDDGWTEGDYSGSQEEQEEQAQEDAGRPGDKNNDDDDDDNERECENPPTAASCNNDTDANGVQTELPTCVGGVIQDCKAGNVVCKIGTDIDPCQDYYHGFTGGGYPSVNNNDDNDNDDNNDSNDNNGKGCYDMGYNSGQNGGYKQNIYNENADCYGEYYKGFMNGCMDEGNRLGVCQNAADIGKEPNPTDVTTQSCYDLGYNDGHNNMQFSKQTYSHCSGITSYDEYYVGFRIGCTSAGNTIDVCEKAIE